MYKGQPFCASQAQFMGMILAKFQHLTPHRVKFFKFGLHLKWFLCVCSSSCSGRGRGKQTGHANLKRRGPFFTASSSGGVPFVPNHSALAPSSGCWFFRLLLVKQLWSLGRPWYRVVPGTVLAGRLAITSSGQGQMATPLGAPWSALILSVHPRWLLGL